MAMKSEQVLADALALPTDERAKLVSKVLASLPKSAGSPRRFLDLAGLGAGIWGDDSAAVLEQQREEWR